ncbi:MAG: hypothetical protein ACI4DY_08005 [Monoglobaceae bacterium]
MKKIIRNKRGEMQLGFAMAMIISCMLAGIILGGVAIASNIVVNGVAENEKAAIVQESADTSKIVNYDIGG